MKPDKAKQLEAFLKAIPEHAAERLAKAIETDRLSGSGKLPHQMILDALRPTLQKIHAPRMPSALRLVCTPFEDLIRDTIRPGKHKGRISRSSLAPVWAWLNDDLLPDKLPELNERLNSAIISRNDREVSQVVETMRGVCAGALGSALNGVKPGSPAHNQLLTRLRTADVIEDAREIAFLLEISPDLLEIQQSFPKPIQSLEKHDLLKVKEYYDYFAERLPEAAPYAPLVVMGRLSKPWHILRISQVMANSETDRLLTESDLRVVGEILMADVEEHAAFISAADPRVYEREVLLQRLEDFARTTYGMTHEVGIRKAGPWGKAIVALRNQVSGAMGDLIEQAVKDVSAAVPGRKGWGYKVRGATSLDLRKPPAPEKSARALKAAALIAGCRPMADQAAIAVPLKEAQDELRDLVGDFGLTLLIELRNAEDDEMESAAAHLDLAVALTEWVLGPEDAQLLRRRGKVARAA